MSTNQKRQYTDVFQNTTAGSASLTPALVPTVTTNSASTIAVPGCLVGDIVDVSAPASLGALHVQGEVQAAGTVTLKFANTTAGSLTPPAGVYTVVCHTLDPKMSL
jgi:hypothetical protein